MTSRNIDVLGHKLIFDFALSHDYPKLLAMVWKRVTDVQHVMHVQKALILIEYLLRNGSQRFVEDCKARSRDIAKLTRYKHYDSNNQDDAKDGTSRILACCFP